MYVQLSELTSDPVKYFDLAKTCDVIVTRQGQRIGRIVADDKTAENKKTDAFDELMRFVKATPSIPDKIVYDTDKEERLKERGLL